MRLRPTEYEFSIMGATYRLTRLDGAGCDAFVVALQRMLELFHAMGSSPVARIDLGQLRVGVGCDFEKSCPAPSLFVAAADFDGYPIPVEVLSADQCREALLRAGLVESAADAR